MNRQEREKNSNRDYWIFISYSHADKESAVWLHRKLESYKIPEDLIGKPTSKGVVPRSFERVFRDEDELAAKPNLLESLYSALENSRNLIVICSPNSARSPTVNQEVVHFKKTHGEANVSCLIVGGIPFASGNGLAETDECFCPALRFEVNRDGSYGRATIPLAADRRELAEGSKPHGNRREVAFLKLVAGVLGVDFDELYRRDRRRRFKRALAIGGASVFGLSCILGLALRLEEVRKALQKTTAVVNRMDETTHREFGKFTAERNSEWKQLVSNSPIERETEILNAALKAERLICSGYKDNAIKFDEAVTNLTPRFENFLAAISPGQGWKAARKIMSRCDVSSFQAESPWLGSSLAKSNASLRAKWIEASQISEPFLRNSAEAETLVSEMNNILKLRPVHPHSNRTIGHRSNFERAANQADEIWNAYVRELKQFPKTSEEKLIVETKLEDLELKHSELTEALCSEYRKIDFEINKMESLAFRENRWKKENSSSARYAVSNISHLLFINDLSGQKTPTLDTRTMALAKRFAYLANWVFWGGAPGTEAHP